MSKKPWKRNDDDLKQPKPIPSDGQIHFENERILCGAIIQEACKEYKQAYKVRNWTKVEALEVWFYSPEFDSMVLGRIHPDSLLRGIRQQVDDNEAETFYRHSRLSRPRNRKGNDNDN